MDENLSVDATMPSSNSSVGPEQIEHRFGTHKAAIEGPGATTQEHGFLRIQFKSFANFLDEYLPAGREKDLAFTELETASMWAHKALAGTNELVKE